MYKVLFSKQARKDAVKIERNYLRTQVEKIITVVENNPFEHSQGFEELRGQFKNKFSRRINKMHRFVYEMRTNEQHEVDMNNMPFEGIVWVLSMWTHYDKL